MKNIRRVKRAVTLNLTDEFVEKMKEARINISEFVDGKLEEKYNELFNAQVDNLFDDEIKQEMAKPILETPEQTWLRIKETVEFIRDGVAEVKLENPDFTIDDYILLPDMAKQIGLSTAELKKWVLGEYSEIEMKANIMEK